MSQSPLKQEDKAEIATYAKAWAGVGNRVLSGRTWSGRERNNLFINTGDGRFADASFVAGFDLPEDGRALALTDWDGDGDLDMWVAARSFPRLRLLLNQSKPDQALVLRLRGVTGNRDAIGARVIVQLRDGPPITRALRAGEGFLGQSSKTLVIGTGGKAVASVTVRWPEGASEVFAGAQTGRASTLVQGSGKATPWPRPRAELAPRVEKLERMTASAASFLAQPVPAPSIYYRDFANEVRSIESDKQHTLVVLWSRWCKPCERELAELAASRQALAAQSLRVVALNVDRLRTTDKIGDRDLVDNEALQAWLTKLAPNLEAGIIKDRYMARLEMLARMLFTWREPLPLPTAVLVDRRGLVRAVYRGRIELKTLQAHIQLLAQGPASWARAAAAGAGAFHAPVPPIDFFALGKFFVSHGHKDAALRYFEAAIGQDAHNANALNMAAVLHAEAGQTGKAEKLMREAIEAQPKHVESLVNLARLLSRRGPNPEIAGLYERALKEEPDSPVLRHAYGTDLARSGRLKAAREQLLRAKELDPNAPVERLLQAIDLDLGAEAKKPQQRP